MHVFPGGSGPDKSLAAFADPSRVQPSIAAWRPRRVTGRYCYPSSFPVAVPLPERCGSTWRFRKVGAALAFALPHASSSLALPIASTASILADISPFRRWQRPRAVNRCRSTALAARRSCHSLPSQTNENCLWIRCITGIESSAQRNVRDTLLTRSSGPCPTAAPDTIS